MILFADQIGPWLQAWSAVILGAILVRLIAATWSTSPALGLLTAIVCVLRVALGLGLLGISSWDLPLLRGVHTGDGFWAVSSDSRLYYELGLLGAHEGLSAIAPGTASPAYTRLLAMWLWALGPWMFAAIILNTVAYACMMLAVGRTCLRGDGQVPLQGVLLSMTLLSLSPSLMFSSTQILKDVVFTVLLVLFAVTARAWLPRFRGLVRDGRVSWLLFLGLGLLALNIAVIAGIRAYYAVFVILGLALPLAFWVLTRPLRYAMPRAVVAGLVVSLLWAAFAVGAGAYYEPYARVVDSTLARVSSAVALSMGSSSDMRTIERPSEPAVVGALDRARRGFVASGGNTNIVVSPAGAPAPSDDEPAPSAAELERSGSRVRSTAVGLAAMFLPLAILEPLGVLDVSLGRVATLIADVDTGFILLSIVALVAYLRAGGRRTCIDWALAASLASIGLLAVVLVAYVVTNIGTLTRLRVPALVFLWLLPLATRVRPLALGERK